MIEYQVINPATGEQVASFPVFTGEQVEAGIASAATAHRTWSATAVAERAAGVRRAAQLHRERREDLARIIVREMGKPYLQAVEEVDFAADINDFYADHAETITRDEPVDILGEGSAVVRRASLGVLLGIMPWNFPYYQVARFAAPNLVLGNTILLKHAPQCPESAAALEQIYRDAGLPEGAYVNVYLTNDQAADVIADDRVQGVSLTGSERAGAAVAEVAGRHLKKVALELGGSDPFILLSTDDIDATVEAAVLARLDNTGQACSAAKRFIIIEELYEEFLEKFRAAMAAVEPGDPTSVNTELGPLSSVQAARNLQDQLDRAVADGATLRLGGQRSGAFFPPAVLTDVTPQMNAYREEFFGPVAMVFRVSSEREAIDLANDTGFGLGSYVFTTDQQQADRVADQLDVGMVFINIVAADSPELPFGGVKRSGTARELGLLGAEEFVNKKLIRKGV
ncbi:NAD-dependent succinate-semialdehyde dehydrogenase [Pseudactinotalea sp. Z1739]|uniref:NAD-dependent succinate-semialdehyde dehydrogenase n=1 Tax=Pseudactinotalea sp. Z1739 TaxID=3413028 RepID=UPI003C7A36CD